jgi:hypothetical protein
LFNIEYEIAPKNVSQPNIKPDDNENGNGNKSSYHQYEEEQKISSDNIHHDDHPEQYSHGDARSTQVNLFIY